MCGLLPFACGGRCAARSPPALEGPRPPTGGDRLDLGSRRVRALGACDLLRQPCRCLWRAVELQMTITRPLRRMTRHLSQIGLTLGLTFTELVPGSCSGRPGGQPVRSGLLVAVDD